MSKAFTKETDPDDDAPEEPDALPPQTKNYVTPAGLLALENELRWLMKEERPRIVEIVSWAASQGDRSENGDYLYNKKRLREIDRRARYLTKRLDIAELVDPARQQGLEQVFFGATVTYARGEDDPCTVQLVGVDEADVEKGKINWLSPLARALMKARVGDVVVLRTSGKVEELEIIAVEYVLG